MQYLDFEQNLMYQNNSIDLLCCGMQNLKGINITLGNNVKSARYAFANTQIGTNNIYNIFIDTNNYINTFGMLDDIAFSEGQLITIKWLDSANDPDLLTYAELYEQYWNNEHIILDCPLLNFEISEWNLETNINDISETEKIGEESYKKIVLKSYKGTGDNSVKTSLYIPKFVIINKETYVLELDQNFYI